MSGPRLVCLSEPLTDGYRRLLESLYKRAGVRLADCLVLNPNTFVNPDLGFSRVDIFAGPVNKEHPNGESALTVFAGLKGIFELRGTVVPIKALDNALIGMPTLSPQYVAADQIYSKVVVADLSKSLHLTPEDAYVLNPSLEDVAAFDARTFSFDIENNRYTKEISVIGLCAEVGKSIVVPFRGAYIKELQRIFSQAEVIVGQNSLQHDEPIMRMAGVRINPLATHYDIMLMQHLLMPDLPHDLEFIASIFAHKRVWKGQAKVDPLLYNARDTDAQWQCFEQLLPQLRMEKLEDLYHRVQVPLARICHTMRETGVKTDGKRLEVVREKLTAEVAALEASLPIELQSFEKPIKRRQLAPPGTLSEKTKKPIKFITVPATETITPWRSGQMLTEYLYTTLNLPPQTHVKTGEVTVDKTALDKLYRKTKLPVLHALKAIKKASTLLSGFATAEMSDEEMRHPSFNAHGTASGRLSSSDPNLQNIPEVARALYVPRYPGWEMMQIDYSGIENRLTALLANDGERLRRFDTIKGYSEHKFAVEVFFGIPYAEVEKDNDKDAPYGKAKRIVHGSNYGMGARKIANMYDMDYMEVVEMKRKWDAALVQTVAWQKENAGLAKTQGWLVTPFGRKRWFYTEKYYTESLSFIPQSSAADVIFKAMIGLYYERIGLSLEQARLICPCAEALPRPALMVLQIHDALLLEYPQSMRSAIAGIVKRVMEQPISELGGYVFPVEMEVGLSWGEMEKI